MKLILSLVQTFSLAAVIYFSAALAFQINAGGDVEYYISIFIVAAAVVYALIDWKKA